ncbi:MAG TPA: M28 family peptidase, partial [Candidatus Limnocylindria bacterium]|nr:M28 family peptidase [Candidatus Limnocylindria bacterium]
QSFVDTLAGRPLTLTNVIARFGPNAGRRIALCAHYDTRAWSDQDPDSARRNDPVPGANDGGSGVAVLLEVAELMALRPPPLGVDLVFFDGEDQGRATVAEEFCLGSRGYAARLGPDRPAAAFVFDLVGDRDLNIHPELYSSERAPSLVAQVLEAARATSATHFDPTPKHRTYDDHIPLLEAGLPAADVIDFDYAAWHTHRDLPDQVSPESLAETSRVAAWLVYRSPLARSR